MKDINQILSCLEHSPVLLRNLLTQISPELYKVRRIKNKWSIHEQACHIATGDQIGFIDRLNLFINEPKPIITPLSGESFPANYLIKMDLAEALEMFVEKRKELLSLAKSVDSTIWDKKAEHPEYKIFTPYIMLRHRLLHDHFHMYRIEELWLANPEYLTN